MRFFLIFIFAALLLVTIIIIKKPTPAPMGIRTKAQTPMPTIPASSIPTVSGWKTYIHKEYGFSIAYPPDWVVLEQPNVSGIEIQKVDKQGLGFSLSVRLLDNPNKLSVVEFAAIQALPKADGTADTPRAIAVDNVIGYKLNYLPSSLLLNIYLPHRNGIVDIFAGGDIDLTNPKTKSYYNNIISQIIGSFRYH